MQVDNHLRGNSYLMQNRDERFRQKWYCLHAVKADWGYNANSFFE